MSKEEAKFLTDMGRTWFVRVWLEPNEEIRKVARDEIIKHINGLLNAIGFTFGRGWKDYDPVIRAKGRKASSYNKIAA